LGYAGGVAEAEGSTFGQISWSKFLAKNSAEQIQHSGSLGVGTEEFE